MEMAKEFESTAVQALGRSKSIRTTVPAPVAALLGLDFGDVIIWSVEPKTGRVGVARREATEFSAKKSSRS